MTVLTVCLIGSLAVAEPRRESGESARGAAGEDAPSGGAGHLARFIPAAEALEASWQRGRSAPNVYKTRITPHWFDSHFWYRNDLPGGRREFILVDAVRGFREPALDHSQLAQSLRAAGVRNVEADRLPIDRLEFHLQENRLEFRAANRGWQCDLQTYELAEVEFRKRQRDDRDDRTAARSLPDGPGTSTRTGPETELVFVNRTDGEVELFWLDGAGRRRSYGKLAAGDVRAQHTYAGHVWTAVNGDGRTLAVFQADEAPAAAEITAAALDARRDESSGGGTPRRRTTPRNTSPDGAWTAFIQHDNVFARSRQGEEIQLSHDGTAEASYGMLSWAPDSKTLVAFRIEPGEHKELFLIESSPAGGERARLHTRPYVLPGDKLPSHELNLFDPGERSQRKPDVEPIDFGRPTLRWNRDGRRFTYPKTDRGHQRFRLIEIDAPTGAARNLIDERSETFIWTAHRDGLNFQHVNWLEQTDEIIYVSQRDGWRHLYLINARTGEITNQITRGPWVVRGIVRIDEDNRQIWFRASGLNAEQDPYLIHYYRINFDGSGLVALTAGNGDHTVQFSPDRQYLIASYSRVDLPPVHELRRVSDGALMCELETAEISELEASGWQPPEVFVAKARDGVTDIWGILRRPRDFDPNKKYPVIEHIYAGPHGSFVPKSFSPNSSFSSLTDLGFIVVQIDGMGTANRSKAFHDVCWQNLKDAGLPDRIRWHQAVAEQYPWYDIDRVGIYGSSAGGQSATAAVLFHPDFYKVAVSACGCHDNRLDKASWNEQWMGYPVGPQYAESSNIENAHRLRGRLLLIVGELDTNVPPESTLRLADALIKADKDFELLVIPGGGHGMGGAYGERRMRDFFIRHLHGVEPPPRNGRSGPDVSRSDRGAAASFEATETAPARQAVAADLDPTAERLELAALPCSGVSAYASGEPIIVSEERADRKKGP